MRGGQPGRSTQGRRIRTRQVAQHRPQRQPEPGAVGAGRGDEKAQELNEPVTGFLHRIRSRRSDLRRLDDRAGVARNSRSPALPARDSIDGRHSGIVRRNHPQESDEDTGPREPEGRRRQVGRRDLAGALLVRHGMRVLAIDLDHQGNFSKPRALSGGDDDAAITADALMTNGVERAQRPLRSRAGARR